jgi:hypothetical protein
MKKWPYKTGDLMTGQENTGDCLIEVTTWAGLTVLVNLMDVLLLNVSHFPSVSP